jgi:hypothetical protein
MPLNNEEIERIGEFLDEVGDTPDLAYAKIAPAFFTLMLRTLTVDRERIDMVDVRILLETFLQPFVDHMLEQDALIDLKSEIGHRVADAWREQHDYARGILDEVRARHYAWGPYCVVCDPDDGNDPNCTHQPRNCVQCRASTWPCETARLCA